MKTIIIDWKCTITDIHTVNVDMKCVHYSNVITIVVAVADTGAVILPKY